MLRANRWLPALLLCALGACGNDQAEPVSQASPSAEDAVTEAPATPPTPATPALPESLSMVNVWTGDLGAMVERRVVRVLTVYGPGRYYLSDGPKGTTAELATKLAKTLNAEFDTGHLKVAFLVIPVARNQLFPALIEGRGDIVIAGTTITEARAADVDFTIPSSKPLKEILVTGPSAPPLDNLSDLAGQTVYLRASSSYAESVQALSDTLVANGAAPIQIERMSELLEDEDLIEMVNTGLLPWAIVDSYKPMMWKQAFGDIVVREDLVFREGARLGWAIRKDSPELKTFLDKFLKSNREGTLFGNILRNRYIRDFDWTQNALADAEISKYRQLEAYFAKHGTAYGIDPPLLAAQGFQESRLDQSVRSSAGAIGVMQLLPSTAKDKNVGIPNIEEVEPNIEAGAKYLAFLRRRYFTGEGYDQLNSELLALAAYNAGPARVRQLQGIARERGYDDTVWFDNVEVIAAEKIGRETVQYVSNIYKYFLTYEMISRQSALRDAARAQVSEKPN